MVVLPGVILVLIWWKRGRVTRLDVRRLLPFLRSVSRWQLRRSVIERRYDASVTADIALTPVERLLVAGRALWFYAAKLIWPNPLLAIYPRWSLDSGQAWQYVPPLAFLGVVLALWIGRHRIGRGPLAAVLIFAGLLLPVLGFFNVAYMQYSYVADHFQYHAAIPLVALAVAAVAAVSAQSIRRIEMD